MLLIKPEFVLIWLCVIVLGPPRFCRAEIGTASWYAPPYTPTACYGSEPSQFPLTNLFAAAGEGIWDNGGACGRQYFVQCLNSKTDPNTCVPARPVISVIIVDRAETSVSRPAKEGTHLVLSQEAFEAIANSAAPSLNVQFQQHA